MRMFKLDLMVNWANGGTHCYDSITVTDGSSIAHAVDFLKSLTHIDEVVNQPQGGETVTGYWFRLIEDPAVGIPFCVQ